MGILKTLPEEMQKKVEEKRKIESKIFEDRLNEIIDKTKLNENIYLILKCVQSSGKNGIKTKDLEIFCEKNKLKRPTFYRYFKLIKKNNMVGSGTDEKHNLVWRLSEDGRNYLLAYYLHRIAPTEEIKHTADMKKCYKLWIEKFPDRWITFDDLENNKELSEDYNMIYGMVTINPDDFPFFETKFRLNKKKLKEWIKEGNL